MARYRVLEKSFIDGKIVDVGDVVHYNGRAAGNLELLDGEVAPEITEPQLMPAGTVPGVRVRADGRYLVMWCLACKALHGAIPINGGDSSHRWTWDGRTLMPSVKHFHHVYDDDGKDTGAEIVDCHYNITNGRILYHGDCTAHQVRGEFDMQPFPEGRGPEDGWLP